MMKWLNKLRPKQNAGPANLSITDPSSETEENREIEGERGIPSVSRRKGNKPAVKWISMIFVAVAALVLLVAINKPSSKPEKAKKAKTSNENAVIENRLPPLDISAAVAARKPSSEASAAPAGTPVPAISASRNAAGAPNSNARPIDVIAQGKTAPATKVPPIASNGNGYTPPTGGSYAARRNDKALSPEEAWKKRRMDGGVSAYESTADLKPANAKSGDDDGSPFLGPQASGLPQDNGLGAKLRVVSTPDARAMTLFDRNFLLAKGSTIDCTLDTRVVTTVPGMIRCVAAHDVYSDNGNVVLMEGGTVFTGVQQGGIKQGDARIFALWERAKTPKGVIINLASPGADSLGGSGLEGYVDRHFAERFGGAVMISMISDLTAPKNTNYQNTATTSRDAVSEALRNTVNIPPTLYKNHGESIMIYVSRDLDFRTVYSLESTDSRRPTKSNVK